MPAVVRLLKVLIGHGKQLRNKSDECNEERDDKIEVTIFTEPDKTLRKLTTW